MKTVSPGSLIVSLDFELGWGLSNPSRVKEYEENLRGTRDAIPKILEIFSSFDIHATWATVGFLFVRDKAELLSSLPSQRPQYLNPSVNAYSLLEGLKDNEEQDPLRFGYSLINLIRSVKGQEIGTHTFSHFCCLEHGQTIENFMADMKVALQIAKQHDIKVESLVFPKNQINSDYLPLLKELSIKVYRGHSKQWFYMPSARDGVFKRACRLMDSYIPLSKNQAYLEVETQAGLMNLRASRFLRPYRERLKMIEFLKVNRIKRELTYAARRGFVYHLWWHPHNFGKNLKQNLKNLQTIAECYAALRQKYRMNSLSMSEYYNSRIQKNINESSSG